MNATTLTTVVGLIIAAIGTIAFPVYLNRSKNNQTESTLQSVDSRAVATMFKDERDRLQIRIDTMQAGHSREINNMNERRAQEIHKLRQDSEKALSAVENKWQTQHDHDQAQIAELRAEMQGLYRQLYRQP